MALRIGWQVEALEGDTMKDLITDIIGVLCLAAICYGVLIIIHGLGG